MSGFDLLKQLKSQPKFQNLPVIIYTSKDLTQEEEAQLKKYAVTIITKDPRSAERLLDETALFLHRVVAKMPASKRKIVENRYRTDQTEPTSPPPADEGAVAPTRGGTGNGSSSRKSTAKSETKTGSAGRKSSRPAKLEAGGDGAGVDLTGHTVLVVDDDMRNIFAITSVLEIHGMNVLFAENGRDSIEMLEKNPGIEIVLMDVMMPEMDGYETMQAIRKIDRLQTLPIIALTAKAMQGDREKCLEAGASDYIPKPVDTERLLTMLRQNLSPAATGGQEHAS
jgi:CheY-like chemotaxis protein